MDVITSHVEDEEDEPMPDFVIIFSTDETVRPDSIRGDELVLYWPGKFIQEHDVGREELLDVHHALTNLQVDGDICEDFCRILFKHKPRKQNAFHENNAEMSPLSIKIDRERDPLGNLRRRIAQLCKTLELEIEKQKKYSEESLPVEEDNFQLLVSDKQRQQKERPCQAFFYNNQIKLAEMLLERTRIIMSIPGGQNLSSKFEDFDFLVFTARINMLENQTKQRLANPRAKCFPSYVYRSDKKLKHAVDSHVKKYTDSFDVNECVGKLKVRVVAHPNTLFVIVPDEAHWGISGRRRRRDRDEDEQKEQEDFERDSFAYDKLVNTWQDFKNVLILQVSATPKNLLTENSRIDSTTRVFLDENKVLTKTSNPKHPGARKLHHVHMSQGCDVYLEVGMVAVFHCLLQDENQTLYFNKSQEKSPVLATDDTEGKEHEFLFQGTVSKVKITSVDGSMTMVKRGDQVFMVPTHELNKDDEKYFMIDLECGADMFHLICQDNQSIVHYSQQEGKLCLKRFRIWKAREMLEFEREDLWLIHKRKEKNQAEYAKQYISLNYIVANSASKTVYGTLIRHDPQFQSLKSKLKEGRVNTDFKTLIAEYAYYILLIQIIRKARICAKSFKDMMHDLHHALGEYTSQREDLVEVFLQRCASDEKENIGGSTKGRNAARAKKKEDALPLEPIFFARYLDEMTTEICERFKKSCKDFYTNPTNNEESELIDNFFIRLCECCLFLGKATLTKLQDEAKVYEKTYPDKFSTLECAFWKACHEFEEDKKFNIEENETCRIIQDLALRADKFLDGKMKVVRVQGGRDKITLANRMYKTLCIARSVSWGNTYTFEILRDYGHFSICDWDQCSKEELFKLYRIWEMLQPTVCEYKPDGGIRSCGCSAYTNNGNDPQCINCNHFHKRIDSYEDLNNLPCLVLVVNRGRMGDTFPESFNCMDLRLSGDIPNFTAWVQEFGRLCKYAYKDQTGNIPYALVAKEVARKITNTRLRHGTYLAIRGLASMEDSYVQPHTNNPTRASMDFQNDTIDKRRILLEAEPQSGKTGTFLCYLSLVGKEICGQSYGEEMQSTDESLEVHDGKDCCTSSDESDTEPDNHESDYFNNWLKPEWSKIEEAKHLKKDTQNGKYCSFYGPFVYGNRPERRLKSKKIKDVNRKKEITTDYSSLDSRFLAFPYHHTCSSCSERTEFVQLSLEWNEERIRFCAPNIHRMEPLLRTLRGIQLREEGESSKKLQNWIFTPSSKRVKLALLNLEHTMVDDKGQAIEYIQIVVVRLEDDFESYSEAWGTKCALISLPKKLMGCNEAPETGGVGYARRFVQQFAIKYGIKSLFMIDDNVRVARQVVFKERNGVHLVDRNERNCFSYEPVRLFEVLKDLELQIIDSKGKPPKDSSEFERHQGCDINTQESYTGPWERYGLIGVTKLRGLSTRVRQPFIRTHVTSLVLINIEALKQKEISYKAWEVWEDLTLNVDCDDSGLFVVKYSRWAIQKLDLKTWRPDIYEWKKNDEMKCDPQQTTANEIENEIQVLSRYIASHCPVAEVIDIKPLKKSRNKSSPVGHVVDELRSCLKESKPYLLLALHDKKSLTKTKNVLSLEKNQKEKVKSHLRNSPHVMFLFAADFLAAKNMRTISVLQDIFPLHNLGLDEEVKSKMHYRVFTTENVNEKSVSLVLLTCGPSSSTNTERKRNPEKKHRLLSTDGTASSIVSPTERFMSTLQEMHDYIVSHPTRDPRGEYQESVNRLIKYCKAPEVKIDQLPEKKRKLDESDGEQSSGDRAVSTSVDPQHKGQAVEDGSGSAATNHFKQAQAEPQYQSLGFEVSNMWSESDED